MVAQAQDTAETPVTARGRFEHAAQSLLESEGAPAVSIRAVARLAGLSATAPYRHYESREALLAALATAGFERFRDALLTACPDGVQLITMEQFERMGREYVAFAQREPQVYRLMISAQVPEHDDYPDLMNAGTAAFEVLLSAIQILQRVGELRDGEPRRLAAHIWSLCHGFASLYLEDMVSHTDPDHDWEREFSVHFHWALSGLAKNERA